jgi:hypothetical protein
MRGGGCIRGAPAHAVACRATLTQRDSPWPPFFCAPLTVCALQTTPARVPAMFKRSGMLRAARSRSCRPHDPHHPHTPATPSPHEAFAHAQPLFCKPPTFLLRMCNCVPRPPAAVCRRFCRLLAARCLSATLGWAVGAPLQALLALLSSIACASGLIIAECITMLQLFKYTVAQQPHPGCFSSVRVENSVHNTAGRTRRADRARRGGLAEVKPRGWQAAGLNTDSDVTAHTEMWTNQ